MADLTALSDEQLTILLHDTMMRHDMLVDSAEMGDERIYFANKECHRIKSEQTRRGYRCCVKCFDFGEVTDFRGDTYGFCDCHMGLHFKSLADRRRALSAQEGSK